LGTGNPDPHVPVERVKESADILEKMNAKVHFKVYDGRPHTISQDEIEEANLFVFK
jgi:phospholipase/carboxylesterase